MWRMGVSIGAWEGWIIRVSTRFLVAMLSRAWCALASSSGSLALGKALEDDLPKIVVGQRNSL
jgi:hypothetical protein